MADKIRIGVVDIYPIFREGVVRALRRSGNLTVVAEAASASEAESIAPKCDVLLLEGAVPGSLDVAKRILQNSPHTKVVFLSANQDAEHAGQALREGVHGYLLKEITGSDLIRALAAVHAGAREIASDLAWRLLTQAKAVVPTSLESMRAHSTREQQVLDHASKGLTNAEMASLLGLSISTIKRHKTRVFRQMGVHNRLQAIVAAVDGRKPKLT